MVVCRGWRETIMSYGRGGGSAGLSGSAGISGSTETSGKNSRKTTRGEWGCGFEFRPQGCGGRGIHGYVCGWECQGFIQKALW